MRHNLNTAAGIVAAMAMKHAMETHDIQGTIKVFINPQRKYGTSLPSLLMQDTTMMSTH